MQRTIEQAKDSIIESVLLEWAGHSILLPIEIVVEVGLWESHAFQPMSHLRSNAVGWYAWKEHKIPLYVFEGSFKDPSEQKYPKRVILYAKQQRNPFNANWMAFPFEGEAKWLRIQPSELAWHDHRKNIATLTQSQLKKNVIIFQSEQFQ